MSSTITVDITDMSVSALSTINIAIVNQPNPVKNYAATYAEIRQLIQIPKYDIRDVNTGDRITGRNIYDYFPEESPGGGGDTPTPPEPPTPTESNGLHVGTMSYFTSSGIFKYKSGQATFQIIT